MRLFVLPGVHVKERLGHQANMLHDSLFLSLRMLLATIAQTCSHRTAVTLLLAFCWQQLT